MHSLAGWHIFVLRANFPSAFLSKKAARGGMHQQKVVFRTEITIN